MRLLTVIAIMSSFMCFLTACDTTTQHPDISNLQPTPQQQHQEKIQNALQS